MTDNDLLFIQIVESRLFTGNTDGSLRIWTLQGLRSTETNQPANHEPAAEEEEDVARRRNAAEQ